MDPCHREDLLRELVLGSCGSKLWGLALAPSLSYFLLMPLESTDLGMGHIWGQIPAPPFSNLVSWVCQSTFLGLSLHSCKVDP